MRNSVEVAKYIENLLEIKGISASELARRTNVNRSTITRYFKGDLKIPMDNIPKFASALNVEPSELLISKKENIEEPIQTPKILETYNQLNNDNKKSVDDYASYKLHEQNKVVDMKVYEMSVAEEGTFYNNKLKNKDDSIIKEENPHMVIAAHIEDDATEEELEEIYNYVEKMKNRKK